MFQALKQRINDMRTIKSMCISAENHAHAGGEKEPGLEHFILAALDLPDGTARKAFERVGKNPDDFRSAIVRQYESALKSIGVDPALLDALGDAAIPASGGLYRAKPQVRTLMEQLAARQKAHRQEPLLGAHVLAAAAAFQQGVASRALAAMGVDKQALIEAARVEADAANNPD